MVFKWRDNHTDRFLNLYRDYEFLWNFTNPSYKNRVAREAAYKEIIAHMKVPELSVRDVKNKIKTVRTNYKFELNKVLRSEKKSTNPSDVYVPHLFWFKKADAFLRDISVTKAFSFFNSECLEEDDNATQQSDLEMCNIKVEDTTNDSTTQHSEVVTHDIKVEDTKLQEVETHFQNFNAVIRNKSPTPAPITTAKEEPWTPTSTSTITILNAVSETGPKINLPRTVLTLPPDITISTNDPCLPRRPATFLRDTPTSAVMITRPTNDLSTQRDDTSQSPRIDVRKRAFHAIALKKGMSKLQKTIELHGEREDDEFDFFGKSLALQLKRMPLERALICQENLQKVMILERLQQNKT